MVKNRLIATLLVHNGQVVQTRRFRPTNVVGNPFTAVDFFNSWAIDEISVLEISPTDGHVDRFVDLIGELSRRCFVPLTVGGKVRDLNLVHSYIRAGADKVMLNTAAVETPELITEIADHYGRQCVVVSIDGKTDSTMPSGYRVMIGNGKRETDLDVVRWGQDAVAAGAGEVMVNSVDHDGDKRGYDLTLIRTVADALHVPVVAMGGVGEWADLAAGLREGHADAVAAGNIFHYTEHSTKKAKEYLVAQGMDMRAPGFYKVNMPRRPKYRPF